MKYQYDLIVIGAGIAGMVSAVTANSLGKRVGVIEKKKVGGNCTNTTCIPSKTLIRAGHAAREMRHLIEHGLETDGALNTDGLIAHIRDVVKTAHDKDLPETFEQIGIRMFQGEASFIDDHHVKVGDTNLSSKYFIIAAGTRPLIPPIAGLNDIEFLTNETIYDLDKLPSSLAILGGGVDGLEYASAFGRLDVQTAAVEMSERLLPLADFELTRILRSEMESDGMRILTGTRAVKVAKESGSIILSYEDKNGRSGTLESDSLLVALGRVPDYGRLALEKAGVKYGNRGIFTDRKLRTSVPNIYACGDIVGPDQLAAMAEYQGIVAATNIFSPLKASIDYANKIYVIFTDPVLAYFGLTEAQAHQKYGHNLSVYRFDYSNMRRALIDGCPIGLGKFLCNKQGKLVGAHILGESAAEVIHEAQLIRAFKKPLHKVNAITHAYPTYSQALVGRAGQLAYLDKMSSNSVVKTALRILPGFSNKLHLARERLAEEERESAEKYLQPSSDQLPQMSSYAGNNSCFICMPKFLTHHDEDPYLKICSKLETKDRKFVVLDFSGMEEINAFGVDMLIKLSAQLARKMFKMIAYGVNDYLKEIFVSTELYKVLDVCQSTRRVFHEIGIEPDHSLLCNSDTQFRGTKYWAKPVYLLQVPPMPREANNLNVDGRRTESPVSGFGQLWEKIYRLKIERKQASAPDVITALKQNFIDFQPPFNRFYATPAGIALGEIVLINSMTPGGPVATGVMIVHCDDNSFTFITPQGHPECGLVSFSAHEENGHTIAQILGLARASDPIFEAAFRMVGSKIQVRIWNHVLTSLALYLGVRPDISVQQRCVDPKMNWSKMLNARYNAQVLTLLNEPFRWFGK